MLYRTAAVCREVERTNTVRKSTKTLRVEMFDRGNTECPICLSRFTRKEAEEGEKVTLEHVPPKGLKSAGFKSRVLCLTCKACNEGAGGEIDQQAIRSVRAPTATVEIKGIKHTATMEQGEDGVITIACSPLREPLSTLDLLRGLDPNDFRATFKIPNLHYVGLSWLKSAYLCLVSLLGYQGHRYARGSVGTLIRNQIMNPSKQIITKCGGEVPDDWTLRSGIYMHVKEPQLWLVQMGKSFTALPKTGDDGFYHSDIFRPGYQFVPRKWYGWPITRFGKGYVGCAHISDRKKANEVVPEDPFGRRGRVVRGGVERYVVIADHGDDFLTLLSAPHRIDERGRRRRSTTAPTL